MMGFWIAAALLSALAAALVLYRAARLARTPEADPTVDLYRRQLSEIDELADRGLLADDERRSARTEAARRLLSAAGEAQAAATAPSVSKRTRYVVLAGAVAAPLAAVGLYMMLGSPGVPDQPFAKRMAAWRSGDPNQLTAPELAAVLIDVVKANPTDPRPRLFLARAQAASGDLASAVQTLRTATRVAPNESAIWASLGEALVQQANGSETADAQTAFRRTIALDPKALSARYHLARAKVMNGDVAGGVADWRSLAAALPPGDPAAVALLDQADRTAKAGRLVEIDQGDGAQTRTAQTQAAQVAPSPAEGGPNADQVQAQARAMQGQAPADQKAFIQTMVDRLAAKLKADPQDFQGWARLIRAYGVLGDTAKQTAARARAEALFKGNPQAMQAVRDAAAPPGALGR